MADHPQSDPSLAHPSPAHPSTARRPRPLSPFLTIYRWPVTMATSITHRATGIALSAGLVLIAWWLVAMTREPEQYDLVVWVLSTVLGQIVLFGFVWSLVYHLLNGIRHLVWDVGYGFKVATANKSGVVVFTLSVFIAIGVFVYAHMQQQAGGPAL